MLSSSGPVLAQSLIRHYRIQNYTGFLSILNLAETTTVRHTFRKLEHLIFLQSGLKILLAVLALATGGTPALTP